LGFQNSEPENAVRQQRLVLARWLVKKINAEEGPYVLPLFESKIYMQYSCFYQYRVNFGGFTTHHW